MPHPQYWSLYDIYAFLRYGSRKGAVQVIDRAAYASLPVEGKVVLDVGAYDGDSAALFLKRGAKKVICIERDPRLAAKIKLPNAEVICESFSLDHLKLPHDAMKCDIEGYEAILLDFKGVLKPTVIEVHNWYLHDRFKERGFRVIGEPDPMLGVCLMRNF